jgi:hypothetical protein
MDSVEAAQWLASMRLDPDEAERADIRHALMMDLLVRLLNRAKKGTPLPSASDFLAALPWRQERKPAPTPVELRHKVDAVMAMLGGRRG